jgi:murein DD-endopeptidase MepM/ murein hydrolase activator NlpD
LKRPSKVNTKKNVAWPLIPEGRSRRVPCRGSPGSFAEDRGDRRHCGVDLYATPGSKVVSIEDGIVLEVGTFTSPRIIPYWNETFYVVVENESGSFAKFAELAEVDVRLGDRLVSGQMLGRVGSVLNPEKIGDDAPAYIKSLKEEGDSSMLHFELYGSRPEFSERYMGGNWFGPGKPRGLLDPTEWLLAISERSSR